MGIDKRAKRRRKAFTARQLAKLREIAAKVYETRFQGKSDSPQSAMGLALDITQPSVSKLLHGKVDPSVELAEQLVRLAGYESLREVVGDYFVGEDVHQPETRAPSSAFSDAQVDLLHAALARQKRRFKNQAEFAAALGITQPALSNLLANKWAPSLKTATHLARLEGHASLEALTGPLTKPTGEGNANAGGTYPNLEACLVYWRGEKSWSPWVVAAARAGYMGEQDLEGPEWAKCLDEIERRLAK